MHVYVTKFLKNTNFSGILVQNGSTFLIINFHINFSLERGIFHSNNTKKSLQNI